MGGSKKFFFKKKFLYLLKTSKKCIWKKKFFGPHPGAPLDPPRLSQILPGGGAFPGGNAKSKIFLSRGGQKKFFSEIKKIFSILAETSNGAFFVKNTPPDSPPVPGNLKRKKAPYPYVARAPYPTSQGAQGYVAGGAPFWGGLGGSPQCFKIFSNMLR